jgi:hypothetical protein
MPVRKPIRTLSLIAAALLLLAAPANGVAKKPKKAPPQPVPMIFVHGQSGSAQQFQANAMRFASNGFPKNRIFAYEYDTAISSNATAIAGLDGFIASVKSATGSAQVDVLAHSRGTTVMHSYLADPARAASVRRYVNFDGRTSAAPPGGVPTMAIWGEGDQTRAIGGATNVYFPNKAHTEVTTSSAAFVPVYKFLRGKKPRTKTVVPEPPKKVTVAGRAVQFPNNVGLFGERFEAWVVDPATGRRISEAPVYSTTLPESGEWGPFKVSPRKHYEFAVIREGAVTIHNYPEPFERDDHLYRVNDAQILRPFIDSGPNSSVVVVLRMREWWGNQPQAQGNDSLVIGGLEVMNPAIAPRNRRVLAVFNFDDNLDGQSSTDAALAPFNAVPFLTAVDNFMPAAPGATGTIPVREVMRGAKRHTKTINVPNWPSSEGVSTVHFREYPTRTWKKPKKGKRPK